MARKYGKKAGSEVEKAMHERKHGMLKSGRSGKTVKSRRSGKTVKSRKQAIAIGLSKAAQERRESAGKEPVNRPLLK